MNQDMQNSSPRRGLKIALAVTLLAIILLVFSYVFTHGKVSVTNIKNWDTVSLEKISTAKDKKIVNSSPLTIPSGKYLVTFVKGTSNYSFRIDVANWLKTTALNPSLPQQAQAQKVSNNTRELHVELNGVIYSMNKGSGQSDVEIQRPSPNLPFTENSLQKLPSPFRPATTYDNQFIGTVVSDLSTFLVAYEPASNQIRPLSKKAMASSDLSIYIGSSSKSGLVYFDGQGFYYLSRLGIDPIPLDIDNNSYVLGDGGPIVSFSGKKLFFYKGPVVSSTESLSEIPAKGNAKNLDIPITLTPYDVITKNRGTEIRIGVKKLAASSITISPDNQYVGLVTDQSNVQLYGSGRGNLIALFAINSPNNFYWQDNNRLLTFDAKTGVVGFDIPSQSSKTIFSSNVLTYSGLEKKGDSLFVTARAKVATSQKVFATNSLIDPNPMLYRIDLGQPATTQSSIDNLPYITNDYIVDTLNNQTFFIPTTGDIKDPLYANSDLRTKDIDRRINEAKSYLKSKNIQIDNVSFSKDLRLNFNLFWAPGS